MFFFLGIGISAVFCLKVLSVHEHVYLILLALLHFMNRIFINMQAETSLRKDDSWLKAQLIHCLAEERFIIKIYVRFRDGMLVRRQCSVTNFCGRREQKPV